MTRIFVAETFRDKTLRDMNCSWQDFSLQDGYSLHTDTCNNFIFYMSVASS